MASNEEKGTGTLCFSKGGLRLMPRPAAYGFEVPEPENSKMVRFQLADTIQLFRPTFGFVWNCLEIFDLDGHNLGTVQFQQKSRYIFLKPPFWVSKSSF
jgi:hypothetical protein